MRVSDSHASTLSLMNCQQIEPLLLAERDGALSPGQRAALAEHVSGCADCRRLQSDLSAALAAWKADVTQVTVPAADAAWTALRPRLPNRQSAPRRKLAPVIWLSAPLAAAAALAFIFLTPDRHVAPPPVDIAAPVIARAEFVEPGNANASTMVYVDKESGWLVVWAADATTHGKG